MLKENDTFRSYVLKDNDTFKMITSFLDACIVC